ncbi:MAG: hypothetical protein ACXWKG_05155 [Limisphaerales bacterium]
MKLANRYLTGALILLGTVAVVLARTIARSPSPSDVAGVYCGYGDQIEFLRLELDTNGAGYLCVSYLPDVPAELYRVDNWHLAGWNVMLETHPLDKDAKSVTFGKLDVEMFALKGQFGGGNGWKRKIELFNQRKWESRAKPVQDRIEKYRQENK